MECCAGTPGALGHVSISAQTLVRHHTEVLSRLPDLQLLARQCPHRSAREESASKGDAVVLRFGWVRVNKVESPTSGKISHQL